MHLRRPSRKAEFSLCKTACKKVKVENSENLGPPIVAV